MCGRTEALARRTAWWEPQRPPVKACSVEYELMSIRDAFLFGAGQAWRNLAAKVRMKRGGWLVKHHQGRNHRIRVIRTRERSMRHRRTCCEWRRQPEVR